MIDCYDGMVVAHTAGTSPNAELANTMLDVFVQWNCGRLSIVFQSS